MPYIKQRTNFDCGPTALVNAFKWLGYRHITSRDLKQLRKVCGTVREGTDDAGMARGIKFLCDQVGLSKSPFVRANPLTMDWLIEALRDGWAVLASSAMPEGGEIIGHYYLVTGMSSTQQSFTVINGPRSGGPTTSRISRKYLRWLMRHQPYPCGWLIRRLTDFRIPRYLSQKDSYSCSPIAVINAFKWLGFPVTADDLPVLKRKCATTKNGTYTPDLIDGIYWLCDHFNVPLNAFEYEPHITFKAIDRYMQKGNGVILSFEWRKINTGHSVFLSWRSGEGDVFETINSCRDLPTTYYWLRDELKYTMHKKCAWIVDHRKALC